MSTPLSHIFDQSACLTVKQIKDYLNKSMTKEECHAAEHHMNNCGLCSTAVEGLSGSNTGDGFTASTAFIKEYIESHPQKTGQIYYAPKPHTHHHHIEERKHPFRVSSLITTLVFAAFIAYGYYYYSKYDGIEKPIKQSHTEEIASVETKGLKHESDRPRKKRRAKLELLPVAHAQAIRPEPDDRMPHENMPSRTLVTVNAPKEPINAQPKQQVITYAEDAASRPTLTTVSAPVAKPTETRIVSAPPIKPAETRTMVPTQIKPVGVATPPATTLGRQAETKTITTTPIKPAEPKAQAAAPARSPEPKAQQANPKIQGAIVEVHKDVKMDGEKAYEQFENKDWQGALSTFEKQMASPDTKERHEAAMMAARSYEKMGKPEEAIKILTTVASENGPQKRAAKRMLRKLKNESAEE
jgi:hypothetical protein